MPRGFSNSHWHTGRLSRFPWRRIARYRHSLFPDTYRKWFVSNDFGDNKPLHSISVRFFADWTVPVKEFLHVLHLDISRTWGAFLIVTCLLNSILGNTEPFVMAPNSDSGSRQTADWCDKFVGWVTYLVLPSDEDKIQYWKKFNCWPPPVFIFLVSIAQLIVFIYCNVVEAKQWPTLNDDALFNNVLIYNPFKQEQAWRFFSYMLLHAGIQEFIGNVLLQLVVGVRLEMVHKGLRVGIVYLSGVFAGSLASSVFEPCTYLLGASAGVSALLGGCLSSVLMNWSQMPLNGLQFVFIITIVAGDFSNALYERFVSSPGDAYPVSFVAHSAGVLAGISVGYVAFSDFNKKLVKNPKFWVYTIGYLSFCVVAAVYNLYYSPTGGIAAA